MITIDSGTLFASVALSEETMYSPSNSTPGSPFTTDPVATISCGALTWVAPTETVLRSFSRPLPAMTSILFFFMRNWTPLYSWFTTASRRVAIFG